MKLNKGFVWGIVVGVMVTLAIVYFLSDKNGQSNKYVQLNGDYTIADVGTLKKGTILKIDKAMSEGFTRYVLYLNLKGDSVTLYNTEHPDKIIPYWLQPTEN
ncbi:MAG: hypothetical protein M0D57_08220 [Sphingobacteriales bacterium JAD_PAG50586_3]|nr:MAG: hypothetical protein M0D57_08220 [Sphingobacteriales bacterium JAD_PAG50586_3]